MRDDRQQFGRLLPVRFREWEFGKPDIQANEGLVSSR